MAYTLTKNADGDLSLGNLRGELCTLQPSPSDYVPGGYLIQGIGGNPLTPGNVGLDKVLFVDQVGGMGGANSYVTQWNTVTSKLQVFQDSGNNGSLGEVPINTNLANYPFLLLIGGL
jgi:hypothetical protein